MNLSETLLTVMADGAAMEQASQAFDLGMLMANCRESFETPFTDKSLTIFWDAGYREAVINHGRITAANEGVIEDCPYPDPLIEVWRLGFEIGEEILHALIRQRRSMVHRRSKVAWHKVGF
jgi:hypothetical protein